MQYKLLLLILCLISTSFSYASSVSTSQKITLTEYYDYECPHCRNMNVVMNSLKTNNPGVKMIGKVTPLLNKVSPYIAALALAGKQLLENDHLHHALMRQRYAPTIESTLKTARHLDINIHELIQIAQQDKIKQIIVENTKLANQYVIKGVIHLPIIVVSNGKQHFTFYGETPYALLSATIQQLQIDSHVQKKTT